MPSDVSPGLMSAAGAAADRTPASLPTTRGPSWLLLAVVCVGQFMVVLDLSIVNVALPAMQ
ncbi:MAG TPA: hypothetical protein VIJ09_14085, partial [Acidimicrobiales bacterium]